MKIRHILAAAILNLSYANAADALVANIETSHGVSQSGAATYSIPIECPEGINGLTPNVSIEYNSQAGNGLLGLGWNIGGLSAITRVPKNYYFDKIDSAEDWDIECYSLDGNRMINQGNTYVLENSDESRIEKLSMNLDGIDEDNEYSYRMVYFKVYKKNGEIWQYGDPNPNDESNRALTTARYKILSWQLKSITDANGNKIIFSYQANTSSLTDIDSDVFYNPSCPTCDSHSEESYQEYNYRISNRIYSIEGTAASGDGYRINFTYEKRKDVIRNYVLGCLVQQDRRLKEITVTRWNPTQAYSNSTYRKYEFEYNTSESNAFNSYFGNSRLKNINIYGENGSRLQNPIKINWAKNSNEKFVDSKGCAVNANFQWLQSNDESAYPCDYNKDGLTDIITVNGLKIRFNKATLDSNGNLSFAEETAKEYDMGHGSNSPSLITGNFTSLNNTDILTLQPSEKQTGYFIQYYDKMRRSAYYYNNLYAYIKLNAQIIQGCYETCDFEARRVLYTVADINNDGYDDILLLERVSKDYNLIIPRKTDGYFALHIVYGTPKESYRATKSDVNVNSGALMNVDAYQETRMLHLEEWPVELYVSDFDGDNLKDICVLNKYGANFWKNTGIKGETNGIKVPDFLLAKAAKESKQDVFSYYYDSRALVNNKEKGAFYVIKQGDFDGDGLPDFLLHKTGESTWVIAYSDGKFGFEVQDVPEMADKAKDLITEAYESQNGTGLYVCDIDGNSMSDIMCAKGGITWMRAIKGQDASRRVVFQTQTYPSSSSFSCKKTMLGDFDGDGKMEILNTGMDLVNGTAVPKNATTAYVHSFTAPFADDKVASITDPMGAYCKFYYKPLTDPSVYSYQTSPEYEQRALSEIPIPLCVVSKMTLDGGYVDYKNYENKTYKYVGALRHLQGKGFLGFRKIKVTDENSKFITTSTNVYDLEHKVLYPDSERVVSQYGGVVRTVSGISKILPLEGKSYRIISGNRIDTDALTGVSVSTTMLVDDYGNVLEETRTNGTTTEVTQYSDYVNGGAWCPRLPGKKVVTRTIDGDTYTQSTIYEYDEHGNLTKETINPNSDLQLSNVYEYNNKGICTKQSAISKERTLTKLYEYDTRGVRLTKMTDELGQETKFVYNGVYLMQKQDRFGTTEYVYDGLGRIVKTIEPNGAEREVTYQYTPLPSVASLITIKVTGKPTEKTIFDSKGEEIGKSVILADGLEYRTQTERLYDGRIASVSAPFNQPEGNMATPTFSNSTKREKYTYDQYQRTIAIEKAVTSLDDLQKTTITYSGLKIKTKSPEETIETELDNAGQQKYVTTNGKRVDFTYYANGQIKTATPQGGTPVTFEYDINGNQTKMVSDEETISSVYDAFGNVTRTTQDVHRSGQHIVTEYTYNAKNLLVKTDLNGEVTTYSYDDKSRLYLVTSSNGHQIKYEYNIFDWLLKKTETIDGKDYVHQYEYDAAGNLVKETYPSGYSVLNTYNEYGYLQKVESSDGTPIWAFGSCDTYGRISNEKIGNTYKSTGYAPGGMVTSEYSGSVLCNMYAYKDNTTLMKSRSSYHTYQQEQFTYDSQNRLTDWNICRYQGGAAGEMLQRNGFRYNTAGDIALITATGEELAYGEYGYPKHAVTSVTAEPDTEKPMQEITYTDFKKVKTIAEGGKRYELFYGADHERRKSVFTDGEKTKTKIYLGNYEKETDSFGAERNLHYICGANGLAAIYVTTADKDTMYYAYTDYQHNLLALTDVSGKPYARFSYDPWGNRRSATDWTQSDTLTHHIINRGYTLHEHLDEFGLINMNGRVYDPKLACFLSPDPYIQSPETWLNHNRYAYCLGNPLKYCDPTGMSETEGDHMEAHAKARHTPSDNNEPIMQWESQNGVIYKIFDCGDKYQFQANYNITCYGLGFMSKGGKTGKSEFDAGFSNSDMSSIDQAFAKFQSGMDNSYGTGGYGSNTSLKTVEYVAGATSTAYSTWQNTMYDAEHYRPTKGPNTGQKTSVWKKTKAGNFATRNGARIPASANAASKIAKNALVNAGGRILGIASIGLTIYDINENGLNLSNGTDFVMSCVGLIPGYGWAISGAYFVGKAGYELITKE